MDYTSYDLDSTEKNEEYFKINYSDNGNQI